MQVTTHLPRPEPDNGVEFAAGRIVMGVADVKRRAFALDGEGAVERTLSTGLAKTAMRVRKLRDGKEGLDIPFTLEEVDLGRDSDRPGSGIVFGAEWSRKHDYATRLAGWWEALA